MELHELVYVSRARRKLSVEDLDELLEQSREKNARLDITGLLVYHEGEFTQLLEGEKEGIYSLYRTICRDTRNKDNQLLWNGPVQHRAFGDWSMAFLQSADLQRAGKPGYSSFLKHGFGSQDEGEPRTIGKALLLALRDDYLAA